MARLRFLAVALLALTLAGNSAQTGRSAGQNASTTPTSVTPTTGWTQPTLVDEHSCVIYSLTDMGYDADLGKWIAQTIPDMVEPKSWQHSGGSGVLRYYAPKNVLIVNHSAAVQSKVDGFLKNLKTSLPKASKKSPHAGIVPAEYRAPTPVQTSGPLPEPSSYPVPAPVKAPKHLFHFIIRYEGEGIIDDNVVKFMKGYMQAESGQVAKKAVPAGEVEDPLLTKPPVREDKKEIDKDKPTNESP